MTTADPSDCTVDYWREHMRSAGKRSDHDGGGKHAEQ
jgi:hypothetical protein